jgi:hypothetical protein
MQSTGDELASGEEHRRPVVILVLEFQRDQCDAYQQHDDADDLQDQFHRLVSCLPLRFESIPASATGLRHSGSRGYTQAQSPFSHWMTFL